MPGAFASVVSVGLGGPTSGLLLPAGEQLCLPPLLFHIRLGSNHSIPIPNDCELLGLTLCSQGAALSAAASELQNAIDFTIGNY